VDETGKYTAAERNAARHATCRTADNSRAAKRTADKPGAIAAAAGAATVTRDALWYLSLRI